MIILLCQCKTYKRLQRNGSKSFSLNQYKNSWNITSSLLFYRHVEMKILYLTSVSILWFTCKAQANGFYQSNGVQPWTDALNAELYTRPAPDAQLFEMLATKRNELLEMAFERLGSDKYVDEMLAISWLIDFKNLVPDQKLVTKKGINDILFEAQLGKLKWDSVAVNEPHRNKVCDVKNEENIWFIPETDEDVNPCIIVCKGQNIM